MLKIKLIAILSFLLFSCEEKNNVEIKIYKNEVVTSFMGHLYTTKYGGLNFYISDSDKREVFLKTKDIDSILVFIKDKKYTAKPLIRKGFLKGRNNSDFSFNVTEKDLKVISDTINHMVTLQFFSEMTDMEKLKNDGVIDAEFVKLK